jgi:predicted transposase YdaD
VDYDPALKQILTFAHSRLVERLAGAPIRRWLNVELPDTRVRRADLLAELETGDLFHLELQSRNDGRMGKRMLEYRLLIERAYDRVPAQMVLYVGLEPLAMTGVLEERGLRFAFQVMDIRDFDARTLEESPAIEDRILAILCNVESPVEAARNVLREIAELPQPERGEALAKLMILSGLRRLHGVLRQEVKRMPLFEHPLENAFLRELYEEGVEAGLEKGIEKGVEKGIVEGGRQEAFRFAIHVLEHRFGPLPEWARNRIGGMTRDQLLAVVDRVLDGAGLADALE